MPVEASNDNVTHFPIRREHGEIRLLRLERSQDENDIIKCRLEYHSINKAHHTSEYQQWLTSIGHEGTPNDRTDWHSTHPAEPRYNWGDFYALSYTWGSSDNPQTILVNDKKLVITANLANALRTLRNTLEQGYYLWVDAVCINQANAVERGLEVSRMQLIYSRATDTIIYLGSENEAAEAGLKFVQATDGCWDDPAVLYEKMLKYLENASVDIWDHIVSFVRLPYWSRQWVMQEMAAGTREKAVWYGKSRTTSQLIWNVFRTFTERHRHDHAFSRAFWTAVEKHDDHLHRLLQVRSFDVPSSIGIREFAFTGVGRTKWSTTQLLSTARKNQATDPHDCVYGMLGLLDDAIVSKVVVDYDLDVPALFESFAKTLVEVEQNLEILGQCDINGSPTWAPRFNVNYPYYRHLHHELEHPYNAHAGKPACASFESRKAADGSTLPTVLKADAVILDRLDGLSTAMLETDYNNENHLYKGGYAEEMVPSTSANNAYGTEENLREALWRTAGGNRNVVGEIPGPPEYSILLSTEVLEDQFHFNPFTAKNRPDVNPWAVWVRKNAELKLAGKRLVDYFRTEGLQGLDDAARTEKIRQGSNAVKRFTNACWSRRIAVTEKGFIGFVPWHARKGDVVAVLPGCSFPALLRETDESYGGGLRLFKFVSPCYVHGVMEGEIWRDVEDGHYKLEEITLV